MKTFENELSGVTWAFYATGISKMQYMTVQSGLCRGNPSTRNASRE